MAPATCLPEPPKPGFRAQAWRVSSLILRETEVSRSVAERQVLGTAAGVLVELDLGLGSKFGGLFQSGLARGPPFRKP